MTKCNAIIEANNEIDKLKKENKKLNELCVKYGFEMGRLDEENEQLKEQVGKLKKENEHFRKVFGNKYDAYIEGIIGGNVNEQ